MKGIVFGCTGLSSSGKTASVDGLVYGLNGHKYIDNIHKLITVTTRDPRPGEEHGRDYWFLTQSQFNEAVKNGEMAEDMSYLGLPYGTLWSDVLAAQEAQSEGKDILVVKSLDTMLVLKKFFGKDVRSIFFYRDMGDVCKALLKRDMLDSLRTVAPSTNFVKRFEHAKKEMLNISKTDYVIWNLGTLEQLLENTAKLIVDCRNARLQEAV